MNPTKVVVIGSGFAGIATATCLADMGFKVTVLEKNDIEGGRARHFYAEGFTFDMGPSWYWMPDVFEAYFNRFGKKASDYYKLKRLDPSYRVVFGEDNIVDVPASMDKMQELFEQFEQGSAEKLRQFLAQAAYKYEVGIKKLVYKPGRSVLEFMDLSLLRDVFRIDVFQSFHKHVRRYFKNEHIIQLLEFPILFLGAVPQNTPALYSLMNYADIQLGTWYPVGGMHKIVEGMVKLAKEKGVEFINNQDVKAINVVNGIAQSVQTESGVFDADAVVASADYHHVETKLLPSDCRSYSDAYWDKRVLAPSSLIFYLGINKRLKNLQHHNLFFDEDFGPHAHEIYTDPKWPSKPLFYVSAPSLTDSTVAPEGCENLFILIPVAPGLNDSEEVREKYFDMVMNRLEKLTHQEIRKSIIYKRSYAHNDFIKDYNAFKGNAYGLANTLMQTAILKPGLKSKKVDNLYYAGQLTVPGPGVPPSLISGQVVADELAKEYKAVKI
jgi:phytoene desaturase